MSRAVGTMAAGLLSALLFAASAVTADAQSVSFCGHAQDGATSSCGVVSPGGLFIAIAPFTFFPFLIIWALSCYCCLKENDFDVDGLTSCCRGGSLSRPSATRRQPVPALARSTLLATPGEQTGRPALGSPAAMTANAAFAPTPINNDAVGIQMSGTPSSSTAATDLDGPAGSSSSSSPAGGNNDRNNILDDESEEDNDSHSSSSVRSPGGGGGKAGVSRTNSGQRKTAASAANNKKAMAAAAAARMRLADAPPVPEPSSAVIPGVDDGVKAGRWSTGEWRCGSCTSINAPGSHRCGICDSNKPSPSNLPLFPGPAKPVTRL